MMKKKKKYVLTVYIDTNVKDNKTQVSYKTFIKEMAYKMSEKLMCHFPHKYFPSVI
jgi:hypothetical protein